MLLAREILKKILIPDLISALGLSIIYLHKAYLRIKKNSHSRLELMWDNTICVYLHTRYVYTSIYKEYNSQNTHTKPSTNSDIHTLTIAQVTILKGR